MGHVIAVANIGQADILEIAEALLQREIVGQRLTGMLEITESVDHRNGGVLGHALNRFLRERTQHNRVHPALEVMRNVAQFFARVKSLLRLVYEERGATQARHSRFERQTSSQRG